MTSAHWACCCEKPPPPDGDPCVDECGECLAVVSFQHTGITLIPAADCTLFYAPDPAGDLPQTAPPACIWAANISDFMLIDPVFANEPACVNASVTLRDCPVGPVWEARMRYRRFTCNGQILFEAFFRTPIVGLCPPSGVWPLHLLNDPLGNVCTIGTFTIG